MKPFAYVRADDLSSLKALASAKSPGQFLAGGTTLVDLMKLDVMQPDVVIDINGLQRSHGAIESGPAGLRLGALAKMSQVESHALIRRDYPVLAQSLQQAASPQLRNMATLGGNVLQRTRCSYFRDVSYTGCNKRTPGSGCSALDGANRKHALLGTSELCIATYPGDFAQALVALGASVELVGPAGARLMRFEELHLPYGDTPHIETTLRPGEFIAAFRVPAARLNRRSLYLKIRDRRSYAFALTSAAVALDLGSANQVLEARIALGGVASRPWRAHEAEVSLRGKTMNEGTARQAAEVAFADARPHGQNGLKVELGKRTLVRALLAATAMEIKA